MAKVIKLRQITKDFEDLLHTAKHIKILEIEEAKIRTRKRKLFQDFCDIIDRMAINNQNSRKEDTYPSLEVDNG